MRRLLYIFALSVLCDGPGAAQTPAVASAIASGKVGERFDGYMGFVTAPNAEVRRQVNAINLRRRNLYIGLAAQRNVTPEVVGLATACELFARLPAAEAYMLNDRAWRRRAGGQAAPVPNYCR
jgi:uncharacterized protein